MGEALRQMKERQVRAEAEKQAKIKNEDRDRMKKEMADRGPGYRAVSQGEQERAAGVLPPGYEGVRDVKTGQLLDQYKSDAYAGEALQKLKGDAFAEGDSAWAKMQLQKQGLEESGARDAAARNQAQAMAQSQAMMRRQGGLSSGASTLMAMQGAKDLMRAKQDVARQGIGQRLGIQEQDIGRKTDLLKAFGDAESRANEANIGRQTDDITKSSMFDLERYKQQMAAYGAKQTADAQRAAASSGGGGKK